MYWFFSYEEQRQRHPEQGGSRHMAEELTRRHQRQIGGTPRIDLSRIDVDRAHAMEGVLDVDPAQSAAGESIRTAIAGEERMSV
jgi:hypothetical protein